MRMLYLDKAASWGLIKGRKGRYLHGVSKQILLCFITITLLRVTAENLYNTIKRYGSSRVQGKNRNIISLEDCHRVLFFFLMESVLQK